MDTDVTPINTMDFTTTGNKSYLDIDMSSKNITGIGVGNYDLETTLNYWTDRV